MIVARLSSNAFSIRVIVLSTSNLSCPGWGFPASPYMKEAFINYNIWVIPGYLSGDAAKGIYRSWSTSFCTVARTVEICHRSCCTVFSWCLSETKVNGCRCQFCLPTPWHSVYPESAWYTRVCPRQKLRSLNACGFSKVLVVKPMIDAIAFLTGSKLFGGLFKVAILT